MPILAPTSMMWHPAPAQPNQNNQVTQPAEGGDEEKMRISLQISQATLPSHVAIPGRQLHLHPLKRMPRAQRPSSNLMNNLKSVSRGLLHQETADLQKRYRKNFKPHRNQCPKQDINARAFYISTLPSPKLITLTLMPFTVAV
ncbi:hypothetical protein [Xylella fastidiosa]|nr:hypothetical protein [Xylella fastidiosa]RWA37279.1 hypothetical protein XfCFBP8078_08335 [Xylella fastidiosa subsp. multiplex]TNV99816.1 hypothetical protein C5H21_01460 [Xylella fastidiosa]